MLTHFSLDLITLQAGTAVIAEELRVNRPVTEFCVKPINAAGAAALAAEAVTVNKTLTKLCLVIKMARYKLYSF